MDVNVVLGAAVAAGGIAGFATKGSVPSLLAGSVGGLSLVACGRTASYRSAAAITAFLVMMMGVRYAKTKKVMPAGLVALLSAGGLVFNFVKIQK
ncbi:unnamed protein product [Effrenium voratum]|uniref:Transmembrane protein 14C n=1 Tax=Effrenium voratum TaxID=2562239 RepID=A0AA36N6X1_9DINO|nr:unnamed protein product [Effrenium voratum]